MLLMVGLPREGLQPAMNGRLGDPCCLQPQRPGSLVGTAIVGRGLQGSVDHLGYLVVLLGSPPARAELVVHPFKLMDPVALASLSDGHACQAHAPCYRHKALILINVLAQNSIPAEGCSLVRMGMHVVRGQWVGGDIPGS